MKGLDKSSDLEICIFMQKSSVRHKQNQILPPSPFANSFTWLLQNVILFVKKKYNDMNHQLNLVFSSLIFDGVSSKLVKINNHYYC